MPPLLGLSKPLRGSGAAGVPDRLPLLGASPLPLGVCAGPSTGVRCRELLLQPTEPLEAALALAPAFELAEDASLPALLPRSDTVDTVAFEPPTGVRTGLRAHSGPLAPVAVSAGDKAGLPECMPDCMLGYTVTGDCCCCYWDGRPITVGSKALVSGGPDEDKEAGVAYPALNPAPAPAPAPVACTSRSRPPAPAHPSQLMPLVRPIPPMAPAPPPVPVAFLQAMSALRCSSVLTNLPFTLTLLSASFFLQLYLTFLLQTLLFLLSWNRFSSARRWSTSNTPMRPSSLYPSASSGSSTPQHTRAYCMLARAAGIDSDLARLPPPLPNRFAALPAAARAAALGVLLRLRPASRPVLGLSSLELVMDPLRPSQ